MAAPPADAIAFPSRGIARPRARVAGLVGPYRLVLAYAFLFYAYPWLHEFPGVPSLKLMMVLLAATTGWLVVEKTLAGESFYLSWPDTHLLLLFLATGVISASNSFWASQTIATVIDMGTGMVVYLLIINVITNRKRLRNLFWALVLGGGVAGVSSMMRFLNGVTDDGRATYAGIFANSNDLAMAMIIVLPLAIALLRGSNLLQRSALLGIAWVLIATVFYTFSRGGAVGLVAALLGGGIRGGNAVRLVLVAAVIAAIVLFPLYANRWDREEGFSGLEDDRSFMGRVHTIQLAIRMFLSAPFTGIGLGTSAMGASRLDGGWWEYSLAIHNTYAQLFAEVGLFGGLAYMMALGLSLTGADRVAKTSNQRGDKEMASYATALEASLIGFMVCAMAGPYLTTWVPLLLVAFISSLRRVDKSESWARRAGAREIPVGLG